MSTKNPKELRRLLSSTLSQRQSSSSSASSKKVVHPFAKYENNKLICIVCSSLVKNDSLWNAHLGSAGHKAQLQKLKKVKERATKGGTDFVDQAPKSVRETKSSLRSITETEKKRPVSISGEESLVFSGEGSKLLVGYGEDEEDEEPKQPRVKRVKFAIEDSTSSFLAKDYLDTQQIESYDNEQQPSIVQSINRVDQLPSDFFDEGLETARLATLQLDSSPQAETLTDEGLATKMEAGSEPSEGALPDDFFDDPKASSSKNHLKEPESTEVNEEEWQLFQKLISKETQVSNKIADADEEALQKDRDEMQEREQEMCIKRLERLKEFSKRVKDKQLENMVIVKEEIQEESNGSEMDEEHQDDDEWMDWRAQKLL
ncbi:hypothetical protein G9A89_008978 [Geosiphon pyriformis]|nr:hypothetical protein G9A89_008978 [Geosiphon pyriformis]